MHWRDTNKDRQKGNSMRCGKNLKAVVSNQSGVAYDFILSYIYFSLLHSCSILSYFVLFCPILFCSVLFCSVLSCSALSCSVLYYKISKHLFTDYHLFRHICLFIPKKPLHSTINFYCLMSSLYFT